MNMIFTYAPVAAAIYLIWLGVAFRVGNFAEGILFKALPVILGILLLVPFGVKYALNLPV